MAHVEDAMKTRTFSQILLINDGKDTIFET